jgi:hypothetical protein
MDDRCMPKARHQAASASQSRDRSEPAQLVIDAIAVSMLPDDTDSSDSSDEMWMRNHPTPRRSSIAFHPYATTTMATAAKTQRPAHFSFDVFRCLPHTPTHPLRVSPHAFATSTPSCFTHATRRPTSHSHQDHERFRANLQEKDAYSCKRLRLSERDTVRKHNRCTTIFCLRRMIDMPSQFPNYSVAYENSAK